MREIRWKKLRAIAKSMQGGASIVAACEAAKLSRVTLWRWRKGEPRLADLIQRLQDSQIEVVEDALYRRAIGYRYEEVTKEKEESKIEKKVAKVVVKEIAPDPTAIMFFLMNRAPERWADKRALVTNTNIIKNYVNPVSKLSDEELDGVIAGFTKAVQER